GEGRRTLKDQQKTNAFPRFVHHSAFIIQQSLLKPPPPPRLTSLLMIHPRPATLGQLKETGYRFSSVKDELRRNTIRKLKGGEELFPGVVGYRDPVIPQIVTGILSKHDILCLGLRGQAKTRMLRLLPELL